MDPNVRRLIEALHHAPFQYVLALTGGGTQAAATLLNVPGGSRTILEVVVPYSEEALVAFLGQVPEQFCSADTSRLMARRAHERAAWLQPQTTTVGGGCTASLASDRPKRGDHRFHLSVQTATGCTSWSLTLSKGSRDREGEELVLDMVLLNALAETFGLAERLPLPLLPDESLHVERFPAPDALSRFYRGELPVVGVQTDGLLSATAPLPSVVLPGSFNPLHAGHLALAEAAASRAQKPVAFEISVENVDKPPLAIEEVRRRVRQFTWRAPVWLTRAPRFVEKVCVFPNAVFVIGVDTAERLVSPKYYEDSEAKMTEALDSIRACGGRFLVAGRAAADGRFLSLDDVAMAPGFRDLFTAIPESECRLDLSSTALRQAAQSA